MIFSNDNEIASVPDIHRDRLFLPRNDDVRKYSEKVGTPAPEAPVFPLSP